ncbi:unnamed protein product [Aphanomyces euteiches]
MDDSFLARERQRVKAYRQRLRREKEELQATIAHLNRQLQHLTKTRRQDLLLSWRDVAQALETASESTNAEHRRLKSQASTLLNLMRQMKAWVAATVVDTQPLDAEITTWRHVTLLSDPEARRLGKEWITKRLFLQTDSMFQRHGFSGWNDSSTGLRELDVRFLDSGCVYTYRGTEIVPSSLEETKAIFRKDCLGSILAIPTGSSRGVCKFPHEFHGLIATKTLRETDGNTMLHVATSRGLEVVNILSGEFNQADRCTFVFAQIQCDDNLGTMARQRSLVLWYIGTIHSHGLTMVFRRFDLLQRRDGTTAKRVVSLQSHCFGPGHDDAFDLEAEAQSRGFSIASYPVSQQEIFFRQILVHHFHRHFDQAVLEWSERAKTHH